MDTYYMYICNDYHGVQPGYLSQLETGLSHFGTTGRMVSCHDSIPVCSPVYKRRQNYWNIPVLESWFHKFMIHLDTMNSMWGPLVESSCKLV